MFKTFSTGVILGVLAAGAAAQFMPLVDLHREASIVTVQPNGGNAELFRINLSTDRVVSGAGGLEDPTPEGLVWPDSPSLAGTEVELFKIRNGNDRVVGVASRIADSGVPSGLTEWALYLPARGAMYVTMSAVSDDGRAGSLRAGTREFGGLRGNVTERYVAGSGDADDGYIELRAFLVSTHVDDGEGATP